ncbi:MAG: hypothetical protein RL076_655 [Chloroflexota bacterium]|jgi:hypothetical protein
MAFPKLSGRYGIRPYDGGGMTGGMVFASTMGRDDGRYGIRPYDGGDDGRYGIKNTSACGAEWIKNPI